MIRTGIARTRTRHMRSLDIAGTGMQAQQTNVEVISNNIANMTTTGFKRERAEFQDLIYQNLRRVGSNSSDTGTIVPSGAQLGLGVKTAAIYRINEQGNLQQTSNTLDLAIQGDGLFPGDDAGRRDRLHPGRHLQPVARRHHRHRRRLHGGAWPGDPDRGDQRDNQHLRPVAGDIAGPDRADHGGAVAACDVSQRRRARGAGRQPVPADRGIRRAGDRQPGRRPASAR